MYDAENRMKSSTINGGTTTYRYDGDGLRATKTTGRGPTTYVYDAMDQLAAQYGGTAPDAGTRYLSVDHLGSTRLVTDGSQNQEVCFDYLPFGEQIPGGPDGRSAVTVRRRLYNSGQESDDAGDPGSDGTGDPVRRSRAVVFSVYCRTAARALRARRVC